MQKVAGNKVALDVVGTLFRAGKFLVCAARGLQARWLSWSMVALNGVGAVYKPGFEYHVGEMDQELRWSQVDKIEGELGLIYGSHMRERLLGTCVKVESHLGYIEKELDLNIQLNSSPLTRLSLLSGYRSLNVYWVHVMWWPSWILFNRLGLRAHRKNLRRTRLQTLNGLSSSFITYKIFDPCQQAPFIYLQSEIWQIGKINVVVEPCFPYMQIRRRLYTKEIIKHK
jgi:hypothetical protein